MRSFTWYKENGMLRCPFCESADISEVPGSFAAHGGECSNEVVCKNCQHEWHEIFQMVDIEQIS